MSYTFTYFSDEVGVSYDLTQLVRRVMVASKYSTDWDINIYYEEKEPEDHWNLRKQFMKLHKGKFPEEYLVAFSKAIADVDFFASV